MMELHGLKSSFDCILFDLDDTLYPAETGIQQACKRNIEEFLAIKCGVSAERACSLRIELFRTYGSSLAGLIALGYDVHPDEYHSYVHGRLPYERITRDPALAKLLKSITQPKILFTNSDREHVRKVLERLGIEKECFQKIVCFETMNPHLFVETKKDQKEIIIPNSSQVILKPSLSAVEIAVRLAGFDPHRMLFMDDSERNVATGKAVGLNTVLVGKRVKIKEANYVIDGIHSLTRVIPEIWGVKGKEISDDNGSGSVRSDLDSMRPPTPVEA